MFQFFFTLNFNSYEFSRRMIKHLKNGQILMSFLTFGHGSDMVGPKHYDDDDSYELD